MHKLQFSDKKLGLLLPEMMTNWAAKSNKGGRIYYSTTFINKTSSLIGVLAYLRIDT